MELNEAGTTIIMVTHSQHYAQFCRRTIQLLDGKIVTERINSEFYV
jgi:putative ABC transport system ATP-binding protein